MPVFLHAVERRIVSFGDFFLQASSAQRQLDGGADVGGGAGVIDDRLITAGLADFEQFIEDNKDEITALQVLYSQPYRQRLTILLNEFGACVAGRGEDLRKLMLLETSGRSLSGVVVGREDPAFAAGQVLGRLK